MPLVKHKEELEDLYLRYNRRQYARFDPIEFLYGYDDPLDCELVGLIASSLAYGRVAQILRDVRRALDALGPAPAEYLKRAKPRDIAHRLEGFKHRFTTDADLAALLAGVREVWKRFGSLEECFRRSLGSQDANILPALEAMAKELISAGGLTTSHLLPLPSRGSACKRLNLFLRWMVRRDDVDPGPWRGVEPSKLLVPMDTHMHRICLQVGATRRTAANLRAAVEATAAFAAVAPRDPVRYDFALTRLGIHPEAREKNQSIAFSAGKSGRRAI